MPKRSLLVWVSFLSSAAVAAPPIVPADQPTIEVRLYNYAEAAADIVDRARQEAGRSYKEIGVSIHWVDCPIRTEDIPLFEECTAKLPPHAVVIRLLPPGAVTPVADQDSTLGYAIAGAHVKRPVIAGVLYGNVENLGFARRSDAPAIVRFLPFPSFVGVVVGRVIAHEISHLLGVRMHGTGLMEANLTPAAIQKALTKRSGFSESEAKALRREIARRGGNAPRPISGG